MSVPIASSRKRSRSPDESAASSYLYPALGRRPSNSTNAPSYPSMIPSHNEYSIGGSSGLSLADGWIDIPYTSNEHLSNDALVASSSFNRNNYSFVGIDVKSNSDPHDQLQEQLDASTAQSKPASAAIGARPKPAPVAKKRPPPPIDSVVLAKSCSRCRVRKVKCDRIWPRCSNCYERAEECDLKTIQSKSTSPAPPVVDPEEARMIQLEARLASLEAQAINSDNQLDNEASLDLRQREAFDRLTASSSIGPRSMDWRLATPAMARSLSHHLCEAFFDSCCSHLPAFAYFRDRFDYRGDHTALSASVQSTIAAFCAVGARASPHSALLGIASDPDDAQGHPLAPLFMAGARRESACRVLLFRAHAIAHEQNLMDEATMDNLAALLAMMQMTIFVELTPKKSRTFVRAALGVFKELQDAAVTPAERALIKRSFAFALYTGDAITSAYARKASLITQSDLIAYFDNVGLVIPVQGEDLVGVLATLLGDSHTYSADLALRTATHLLSCWTSGNQRTFAKLASPPAMEASKYPELVRQLWASVDQAREGIAFVQQAVYSAPPVATPHSPPSSAPHSRAHSHSHSHSQSQPGSPASPQEPVNHSTDYLTQVTRFDRDLLDIDTLIHVLLTGLDEKDQVTLKALIRESTSRVRKGLKVLAFYAKVYVCGHDRHLIFHHAFQMELNPKWSQMVLERFGTQGGPETVEEEVSDIEVAWLVEGLQDACFYMPNAEKRLNDLAPRFQSVDPITPSSPPSNFSPIYSQEELQAARSPAQSLTSGPHAIPPSFYNFSFTSPGSLSPSSGENNAPRSQYLPQEISQPWR